MSQAFRRLIAVPPDATAEQLSQVREALAEAVAAQQHLAGRTPHVLRFDGSVEEGEGGLFIGHEPAGPLSLAELFEPQAPITGQDELLRAAAALCDALAEAHGGQNGQSVIHGGLCPGCVVAGEDGFLKVTDFGFARIICEVFGVESYRNLAVGPGPAATGTWEVLASGVVDRDDRLCAFIDPDKYGQGALASFEAGSDIIAAGFVLYLLAEHRHPYLFYEAGAHRVVDMVEMMSFGVPLPIGRQDLVESDTSAMKVFRESVLAMLARVPAERPAAGELAARFAQVAPKVDLTLLKAERWVAHMESLVENGAWTGLSEALPDRPELDAWPPELLARADKVEKRLQKHRAEAARKAAVESDRREAEQWLAELSGAAKAADWDAADRLLSGRPKLTHWPENTLDEVETIRGQVRRARAEEQAREWAAALREAHAAQDWDAVGRHLAERPAQEHCSADIVEYAATVEGEYTQVLEQQERERQVIAEQHAKARAWQDKARKLADAEDWVGALDVLAEPPELTTWPDGVQEEAAALGRRCRDRLSTVVEQNLDQVTESVRRAGEAIVHEVVEQRLGGLIRADDVETGVESVVWAPDGDVDGHGIVLVRVRPAEGRPDEKPIKSELDFRMKGLEPKVCRGQAELRERVERGLREQLARLQAAALGGIEDAVRARVSPLAVVAGGLDHAVERATMEIRLLGAEVQQGIVSSGLRWDVDRLAWVWADPEAFSRDALAAVGDVTREIVLHNLVARSERLRAHKEALTLALTPTSVPSGGELPSPLSFEARIGIRSSRNKGDVVLGTATVTSHHVGRPVYDGTIAELESRLGEVFPVAGADSH